MLVKYEAKKAYATRKMRENKKVETLSEEQHNLLDDICELRHKLHTSYDRLWVSGSVDNDELSLFIAGNADGEGSWLDRAKEVGLPTFGIYSISIEDILTDIDYDNRAEFNGDDREEDENYSVMKEYQKEAHAQYDKEHSKIEQWLKMIDELYGTHYAPTGLSRI